MKRLAAFILLAILSVTCFVPPYAQARANGNAQLRKAAKKQQKATKKYVKAQRKAQRKMIKQDRKNTHYPSTHY